MREHLADLTRQMAQEAVPQPMRIDWRGVRIRLDKFQRTKLYDLGIALPFIAFVLLRVLRRWPRLAGGMHLLFDRHVNLLQILQLTSVLCFMIFSLLLLYLLVTRKVPERKAEGLLPRAVAICGTFSTLAFPLLNPVRLSLPVQALSTLLIAAGLLGSVIAAAHLGRSFSLLPEARRLVTRGPYAIIRHPLYFAEMFTIVGIAIQFQQPSAFVVATGVLGLQYWRMILEERVLTQAYPEYEAYVTRTWRFIPYIL